MQFQTFLQHLYLRVTNLVLHLPTMRFANGSGAGERKKKIKKIKKDKKDKMKKKKDFYWVAV